MEQVITIQLNIKASAQILNDRQACEKLLDTIIEAVGMNTLGKIFHHFEPQGLSLVYLLSESHIALHTWPESESGYITISTCQPDSLDQGILLDVLKSNKIELIALLEAGRADTL